MVTSSDWWWLRSSYSDNANNVCNVNNNGNRNNNNAYNTNNGAVPICIFNCYNSDI